MRELERRVEKLEQRIDAAETKKLDITVQFVDGAGRVTGSYTPEDLARLQETKEQERRVIDEQRCDGPIQ